MPVLDRNNNSPDLLARHFLLFWTKLILNIDYRKKKELNKNKSTKKLKKQTESKKEKNEAETNTR